MSLNVMLLRRALQIYDSSGPPEQAIFETRRPKIVGDSSG